MWVDANISKDLEVPQQELSLQTILDFASDFFTIHKGPADGLGQDNRLMFPLPLDTFVRCEQHVWAGGSQKAGVDFPRKVTLLVGHAVVYAWYYAMGNAMLADDRL